MEKYKLYDNKIELSFDEVKHRYYVNGKVVQGVTSILNILGKPALLPWAINQAMDVIKSQITPGHQFDEIEIEETIKEAKMAYKKNSGKAATIGTKVHEWIENFVKKEEVAEVINPEMQSAIDQFMEFGNTYDVKFKASEQKVYSKEYEYAGTFDGIIEINKGNATISPGIYLMDIKTSKGIYPEYWLQLGAYYQAIKEEKPKTIIDGGAIIKCGKDGTLEVATRTKKELIEDQEAFLSLLKVSKWLKKK